MLWYAGLNSVQVVKHTLEQEHKWPDSASQAILLCVASYTTYRVGERSFCGFWLGEYNICMYKEHRLVDDNTCLNGSFTVL